MVTVPPRRGRAGQRPLQGWSASGRRGKCLPADGHRRRTEDVVTSRQHGRERARRAPRRWPGSPGGLAARADRRTLSTREPRRRPGR